MRFARIRDAISTEEGSVERSNVVARVFHWPRRVRRLAEKNVTLHLFVTLRNVLVQRRGGQRYPLMGTEVIPQQLAFFATQHGVSLNWVEQHFSE